MFEAATDIEYIIQSSPMLDIWAFALNVNCYRIILDTHDFVRVRMIIVEEYDSIRARCFSVHPPGK